jgi:dipeptidyl aminopeptidase/acylaminoacyl peptidase
MRLNPHTMAPRLFLALFLAAVACGPATTPSGSAPDATMEGQPAYLQPPQEIIDILDAAPAPGISVSPDHHWLLKSERLSMPTIEQLAQPVLGLAGARINPRNNGSANPAMTVGLSLINVSDGSEREIQLPDGARLSYTSFSPDGRYVAFLEVGLDRLTQWVAEVESGQARAVSQSALNGASGPPCSWMPDSQHLLCKTIPAERGAAPEEALVPAGPTILETSGDAAPVPTYQNLLASPTDEALFTHYFTSQLALVSVTDGAMEPLGEPAIFLRASSSPDGSHLLVSRTTRPYSYLVPASRFPQEIDVWTTTGELVAHVTSQPLADSIPIGGVQTGMRSIGWRPGTDATLTFVEALDEGDPRNEVPHRDRLMSLASPFDGEPVELARTEFRYRGTRWTADASLGLVSSSDRKTRRTRTWILDGASDEGLRLLWDRLSRDRYNDPGSPMMTSTARGEYVLQQAPNGDFFLRGSGASPQGDRPFLDRLSLSDLHTERLFQTEEGAYETVVALLDEGGSRLLIRRETPADPPNYFVKEAENDLRQLTHYEDPAPQLAGIQRQLLTYDRGDGVQLSGTLILPPDYQEGERLPVILWIYPSEFTSAATASQVSGSASRFTRPRGSSHLFLLTQGYAILDGPTLPVIGAGETANDTYIEQTARGAEAAIRHIVEMGVADENRIGVGGHSYGAFATAHLLASTDLFKTGVARSGAYNRTLTPFGFQNERRTLWEDKDLYMYISPFMYADQINEPLLMIHGQADTNSGTFPIQSDRMYRGVKGHGGTVTLVKYPYEGHGYRARESVMDCVARMIDWFDRYVKEAEL